ncbi:carboxylesterase family protein [Polaromonas sp. P1-6]|nr:carboxylesterase family protein [Polaromonas sp. P1-6]
MQAHWRRYALPADKIVAGLNLMNVFDPTFASAMIDGQIVVDEPGNIFRSGQANKVPYMVGATNMDLGFSSAKTMDEAYAPFGPANRQAAEAAFNPLGTGNVSEVVARIASDMMMVEPALLSPRRFLRRVCQFTNIGFRMWRQQRAANSAGRCMPANYRLYSTP